jgi:transketolase
VLTQKEISKMKKLLLVILTMAAFATHTYANDSHCVPTKTVEEAKAQFDAGVAAINVTLQADYAKAMAEYDQSVKDLVAKYYATLASIDNKYESDAKEIQNSHRPGWQQALTDLRNKRNIDARKNYDQYYVDADSFITVYYQKVELAKDKYRRSGDALVSEYNTSVCLGS